MDSPEFGHKQACILSSLSSLPRKMVLLHGRYHNVPEFVLHELCKTECFNLPRAAYFVDNPDFDCLKGIAGYCQNEIYGASCDIWQNPQEFSDHMQKASFNNKVRSFSKPSLRKSGNPDREIVEMLAHELDLQRYGFQSWNMKHDNHGLFIYEMNDVMRDLPQEFILNGLGILSFCPIA